MSNRRGTKELHPVVQAFIDGCGLQRTLETYESTRPDASVVRLLGILGGAVQGEKVPGDILGQADSVDVEGIDPSLLMLFYSFRCAYSISLGRYGEAAAICNRMEKLAGGNMSPEISVRLLTVRAAVSLEVGQAEQSEGFYRQAMAHFPRRSPRFRHLFNDWASLLAARGKFAEISKEYDRLIEPALQHWREYVMTMHYAFTGRFAEMGSIDRERVARLPPRFVGIIERHLALAEVLMGRRSGSEPNPALDCVRELLAGNVARALALAREQARADSGFMYGQDFVDLNLLRCELASGQAEAARRLIRLRRDIGNGCYLDGFFMSRACLLDGDRSGATRHFAAAYRDCVRYSALQRVEWEVRLAAELRPAQVLNLMAHLVGRGKVEVSAAPPSPTFAAGVGASQPPARPAPSGPTRLVGASHAIAEVRRTALRLASLDLPVLLTGETGVGKELVARTIHESGPRAGEPFLAVNCGAISESLLESELFGHRRGAFTGAEAAHKGILEEAGGGTVLLDEIGETSPRLQVALLRALENNEVRAIGSAKPVQLHCRLVMATNADLPAMVENGAFRKDLLYRIRRFELHVPPLRERREDILPLAEHFLAAGRTDGKRPVLAPELGQALFDYAWPGNVRELRNEMERMRLMNSDKLNYGLADADPRLCPATAGAEPRHAAAGGALPEAASPAPEAGRLVAGRSRLRREDGLRELFRQHGRLTRQEVVHTMRTGLSTATADLARLCAEGFIERVEPTASPRTHYFRLKTPPATPSNS